MILHKISVRTGQVLSNFCLIDLRKLDVVGMKSSALRPCASSGLHVWARIVFVTAADCFVFSVTHHIPVFMFLVALIVSCPFFRTGVSCLYSFMVHPSSNNTSNYISGAVFIFGKCGSASLSCLDLVDGVLLYIRNPLCYHMIVFVSFNLILLQEAL